MEDEVGDESEGGRGGEKKRRERVRKTKQKNKENGK